MAQDETYLTAIYTERDNSLSGGTQVVGSGGVVEYASGGTMLLDSGATMSLVSGATFGLAGGDIAVEDMRRVVVSEMGGTVIIEPTAGNTVLPTLNLPKNVRIVEIYGSDTTISASFWLTSVSAGREVYLNLRGDSTGTFTNASTQIDVSLSGCILLNSLGAAISGFEMHTSAASDCGVHLISPIDDVWAINRTFGDIDE